MLTMYPMLFIVCQYQWSYWLWRPSPKWTKRYRRGSKLQRNH